MALKNATGSAPSCRSRRTTSLKIQRASLWLTQGWHGSGEIRHNATTLAETIECATLELLTIGLYLDYGRGKDSNL